MHPVIESLRPKKKELVYHLVQQVGIDTSDWTNYKDGKDKPAANPNYCYNWSFSENKIVVVCLWVDRLDVDKDEVYWTHNFRKRSGRGSTRSAAMWARRANQADEHIRHAYLEKLPLRAIICDGRIRDENEINAQSSRVKARRLDEMKWAVTEYDNATGDCLLVRGAKPVEPIVIQDGEDDSAFEGAERLAFIRHRHREASLREKKIRDHRAKNGGRLICEVPKCGFDFQERYGDLGAGYAQVHHTIPLSTAPARGMKVLLDDLAVVCANCHAIIHRGGKCRPLEGLIGAE